LRALQRASGASGGAQMLRQYEDFGEWPGKLLVESKVKVRAPQARRFGPGSWFEARMTRLPSVRYKIDPLSLSNPYHAHLVSESESDHKELNRSPCRRASESKLELELELELEIDSDDNSSPSLHRKHRGQNVQVCIVEYLQVYIIFTAPQVQSR
jgi:hypothetical protein